MRDLTSGSIPLHFLKLGAFLSVSFVLQTLYLLADLYWVGKLGPKAIAAVSLTGSLYFVVLALGQVIVVGTTAMVAQGRGAGDRARAQHIFNQSMTASHVLGVIVGTILFLIRPWFFDWMGADAETAALGMGYLGWFAGAALVLESTAGMGGGLRGIGDLRTPMIIGGIAVTLNMILDPVLIFGWGPFPAMGIEGAALATLIAFCVMWLLSVLYFSRRKSYLQFSFKDMAPDPAIYKRMGAIGLPAGTAFGILSSFMFIIFWAISSFGAAATAGYGIGHRVIALLFLPVLALAIANASIVGQNVGARNAQRVARSIGLSSGIGAVYMLMLSGFCLALPDFFVRYFSDDPEVVRYGAGYIGVVAWNFIASGLVLTTSTAFQGLGRTVPPLLSSVLRLMIFSGPVVYLTARGDFALETIWWLWVGSVFVQGVMNLALLRREFRRIFPSGQTVPAQTAEAG